MARDVLQLGGLLVLAVAVFLGWRSLRSETPVKPPEPDRGSLREPRVVVRKAARELLLYDGPVRVKRYAAGIGRAPVGDKRAEGDLRTPEGTFYVCTRNDRSRFRKFLGLSYPSPAHAELALREGRITRAQHDAVATAHRERRCPPWYTPLGGEVGIHGDGPRPTLGCISVADADIDELWPILKLGTPVVVEP